VRSADRRKKYTPSATRRPRSSRHPCMSFDAPREPARS
jgi:hypothetical protein